MVLSLQIQMLGLSPSKERATRETISLRTGQCLLSSLLPFLNTRHADREFLGEDLFCAHHFDQGISLHLCQAAT